MNICISTLTSYLPQNMQTSCANPKAQILGIKDLKEINNNFNPFFLYTGNYADIVNSELFSEANLLLYTSEKLSFEELNKGYNIIVIHDPEDYRTFINLIQDILANAVLLVGISNNMLSILQNGGDVQKMLNYGFEVLNNPLMLVDTSFDFIGSAGTNTLNDEPIWQYAITRGSLPEEYIRGLISSATEELAENALPHELLEEKPGLSIRHKQIAAKIIQDNKVIGYIKLLEKNRVITQFDKSVLLCLSNFLSIIVSDKSGKHTYNSSMAESFLTSIISQKIKNPKEIESRQDIFNIKLYDNLHIITIEMDTVPSHPDHIYYLLKKFKKFFDRNVVVLVNTRFVVLYDTKTSELAFPPTFIDQFSARLNTNNCSASISLPFKNLKDLYLYYEQTLFCFELRSLLAEPKIIISYQDIIEEHMIINFGKMFNLNFLIHPVVYKLIHVDKDNESELVHTLFTYIRHQQNISATAKALYLHYNTVKYRINRITELCCFDFSNARDIFLITLSEKVLRLQKMMETTDLYHID